MAVSDWSAVADENTSIDGINIAEHCPAKNINNAIRSVMAALKTKCDALDSTDNSLRRGSVIGEIRWFAMSTPPTGWLLCNGATVGRTTYSALFAAIGTTYGAGDGSTTFALPNLIGRVMWGGTSPGQYLAAGLPNISYTLWHVLTDGFENEANGALTNVSTYSTGRFSTTDRGDAVFCAQNWDVSAQAASTIYGNSDTVQPPAITLLPCIKY